MSLLVSLINRFLADPPRRPGRVTALASFGGLFLLAAFAFAWRLGDRGLWGSEEPRVARETRAELDGGRWGYQIGHHSAHLLFTVAASRALHAVSEASIRLPSAAMAFVLLLALCLFARERFGDRTALLTGVVFATSVGTIVGARSGTSDVLLGAVACFASLSAWRAREQGASVASRLAPCVVLALGVFMAGPMAATVPLGGLLSFEALLGRGKSTVPRGGLALLLTTGVACTAAIAAQAHWVGAGESFGEAGSGWTLLLSLAPWVFFLPGALLTVLRDGEGRSGPIGYALCCAAFAFAAGVLTGMDGQRLSILVLPWTSLLVARFWGASEDVAEVDRLRQSVGLPFSLFILALPTTVFLLAHRASEGMDAPQHAVLRFGLFLVFVSNALVILVFRRNTFLRFASLGVASLLALSFAVLFVVPRIDERRQERQSREEAWRRREREVRTAELADAGETTTSDMSANDTTR